jgi:hypothetical protein
MPLTEEEQSVKSHILECLSQYYIELGGEQRNEIVAKAYSLLLQCQSLLSKYPTLRCMIHKKLIEYEQFESLSANFIIIINQLHSVLETIHMRDDYVN